MPESAAQRSWISWYNYHETPGRSRILARPKKKIPLYLPHLASGQARVRVNGRDIYLGPCGSALPMRFPPGGTEQERAGKIVEPR